MAAYVPDPDLLFNQPASASTNLVFGAVPEGGADVEASIAATLPAITFSAAIVEPLDARIVATLPPVTLSASAEYRSNTARPTVSRVRDAAQSAGALPAGAQARQQDTRHAPEGWAAFWQRATRGLEGVEHRITDTVRPAPVEQRGRFQDATRAGQGAGFASEQARRTPLEQRGRFEKATGADRSTGFAHQDAERLRSEIGARHQVADVLRRLIGTDHQSATPDPRGWSSRYQEARRPPIGTSFPFVPPPPPPPTCYLRSPHLVFAAPWIGSADLLFACDGHGGEVDPPTPPAGIVIPVLEYYVVINNFSLVRADTGQPIECAGFQISLDVDSFTWSWSASVHASLLSLVRPDAPGQHVEVIASVNGTQIRLLVERLSRDRRFAQAQLRVSGRGRAAWLADPHSPIVTRTNGLQMTAQQILNAALTENGVSLGWTVDWRIQDWQVAANAYSQTGTYIEHASRIAEAGGAYIQPHNTAQTLIVLPRYPAAPWAWGALTPDIELPEDVVEVEGIEWLDRPDYNAVWVGDGGRLDKIKRAGTAGDRHAQTVVDAIATAPEATRQRGLAVLGDTGRQAHISLRLPVLAESGIIRPGQLVRYSEQGVTHTGLARSVNVDVSFPETWQTVKVETHVESV